MSNTKQQIEEIPKELADGWRGWVHDQLDGTSFIADELKEIEEAEKRAVEAIDRLVTEACLQEFKTMWNKTQPDIVPEGWTPDTEEGEYIKDRIAELKSQLNEEQK